MPAGITDYTDYELRKTPQRKGRVLRNLHVDDVSSVDVGAARGARVMLRKRSDDGVSFAPQIASLPPEKFAKLAADHPAWLAADVEDARRLRKAFNPDQPRDNDGKWTGGGTPESSGRFAGIHFEGTAAEFQRLKDARAKGAGRDEIEALINQMRGTKPVGSLEDRIRRAYLDAAGSKGYGARVTLQQIRQRLSDVPRSDLDAEFKRLGTDSNSNAYIYPNDNKPSITAEERAGAFRFGGEDAHVIYVTGPRVRKGDTDMDFANELTEEIRKYAAKHGCSTSVAFDKVVLGKRVVNGEVRPSLAVETVQLERRLAETESDLRNLKKRDDGSTAAMDLLNRITDEVLKSAGGVGKSRAAVFTEVIQTESGRALYEMDREARIGVSADLSKARRDPNDLPNTGSAARNPAARQKPSTAPDVLRPGEDPEVSEAAALLARIGRGQVPYSDPRAVALMKNTALLSRIHRDEQMGKRFGQ